MTTYRNTTIARTEATCLNNGRKLYSLTGEVEKDATVRPFITSIRAAREFINQELDLRTPRDQSIAVNFAANSGNFGALVKTR